MRRNTSLILVVVIVCLVAPVRSATVASVFQQTTATDSSERQQAIALYDQKKFSEARELLAAIVKKNKTDHLAWYYLGFTYLQQKKYKDASKALETAVKINPGFAAAHSGLGYLLLFRGKWKEAIQAAEVALRIDPKLADAHYVLGVGHLRTGDESAAVVNADAAIDLNPKFAPAYLLKSQAIVAQLGETAVNHPYRSPVTPQIRRADYAQAAGALQKYLELEPNSPEKATWTDQLESLRFYGEAVQPNKERNFFSGSEVTVRAQILRKPEPAYTEEARAAAIVGRVALRAVLAGDGTIQHLLVLRGLPYGLTEAALKAARQIKFVPASLNGQNVSTAVQLEYNFYLY